MDAVRLDGRALSLTRQAMLKDKVAQLKQTGITPGLVVLLIGDDAASQVYVRNKEIAANKVGFHSVVERLSADVTQAEVLARIQHYNEDKTCHGILIQLPLPKHLDEQALLTAIDYRKDVDGFHPMNMGNFFLGNQSILPCTPYGIMTLLDAYQIDVASKLAVVIGRSNIVGKPIAQMLLQKNATVVMTHSRTKNLTELTKQADILIVAIGQGHFIHAKDVKAGAVVIDVGMNRDANGKLIGDVADDVWDVAYAMTPVPGGVGPMTIMMLLEQTYQNAVRLGE